MMNGCQEMIQSFSSRRMNTQKISGTGKNHGFIQNHPVLYPVAEMFYAAFSKITKPVQYLPVRPSAFMLQHNRKIPVIQCDPGLNTTADEVINNQVVIVNAFLIDCAGTQRKYSAPGNGKTIIRYIQFTEEADILNKTIIEIAGYISVMATPDFSFSPDKFIPDGKTFAIGIMSALNLIRCCGYTPLEIIAESCAVEWHVSCPIVLKC